MALRNYSRRQLESENEARLGKAAFKKPTTGLLQPRAALGTLNVKNMQPPGQEKVFKKFSGAVSGLQRQPLGHITNKAATNPAQLQETAEPECMDVNSVSAAFQEKLMIEDIDQNDHGNPQLCSEYVRDIYKYLRHVEKKVLVDNEYIKHQPHITERMRQILIDWLIQVHARFGLFQETLYLTVSIIDRYLEHEKVQKSDLQLVGVTAMLIASKYEEMYAPEVKDFVYITDNTYTSKQIQEMEIKIMEKLDYYFGDALAMQFLRRNSKAGTVLPEMHMMAKFILELGLPDYQMLQYPPSMQAGAALCLTIKLYNEGSWDSKMRHYSTYSEEELGPCLRRMAELISKMHTSKQQAVRQKYAAVRFCKISKNALLKSQTIQDLLHH